MRAETSVLALAHEERSDMRSVLSFLELENLAGLARLSKPLKAIVLKLSGWKLSLLALRFDNKTLPFTFLNLLYMEYGKAPGEV